MASTSVDNSSVSPLNNFETFIGVYENILNYSEITFNFKADTTSIITLFYSIDGVNTTYSQSIVYTNLNNTEFYRYKPLTKYFKIEITNNSGTNQTFLNLYTYYRPAVLTN